MTRKVIIDTDPGHDDALAILLAAQHFDVLGITTVHGNQAVEKTTRNALRILELAGLTDIPVYKGSDRPIAQPPRYGSAAHGESGLDGAELPEATISAQPGHAVDFLVDTIMSHDEVTVIPVGPLTNVGLALHREPRLKDHIREISLMGGSTGIGNSTAAAELNIWCDPEAAHLVFTSGVPIKMVGLNLTRQTVADPALIARFRALNSRTSTVMADLIAWYSEQTRRLFGLRGASLHDPCAVAWLIDPSLIESVRVHVGIELRGERTRGMTVCDMRHLGRPGTDIAGEAAISSSEAANAEVGMKIDAGRFYDLLLDSLAAYP